MPSRPSAASARARSRAPRGCEQRQARRATHGGRLARGAGEAARRRLRRTARTAPAATSARAGGFTAGGKSTRPKGRPGASATRPARMAGSAGHRRSAFAVVMKSGWMALIQTGFQAKTCSIETRGRLPAPSAEAAAFPAPANPMISMSIEPATPAAGPCGPRMGGTRGRRLRQDARGERRPWAGRVPATEGLAEQAMGLSGPADRVPRSRDDPPLPDAPCWRRRRPRRAPRRRCAVAAIRGARRSA